MDLNLKALIGVTYLVPIALTLRRVYAPSFEMPEAFATVLAKMDANRQTGRQTRRRPIDYTPLQRPSLSRDMTI